MLEFLGFLCCEFSFRWFDLFASLPVEGSAVRWYHRAILGVGDLAYATGCKLHELNEEE